MKPVALGFPRILKFLPSAGLAILVLPTLVAAENLNPDQLKFFETKIRPILSKSCYRCHSIAEGKSKGFLTLDTKSGWQEGGESGPAIMPGDPLKSLIIKAVCYEDPDMQMPPDSKGGKLPADQIADLVEWVKMGAPDPRTSSVPRRDISKIADGLSEDMKDSVKTHWSYQPVVSPPIPKVSDASWCKTEVDHFILSKLEEKGMKPSAPADKRTLIRRATFDLIGLPPSPKEVLDFVNDNSPTAYEKVVDRLLASPHYGERWGRYWLDVARYADTRGEVNKDNNTLNPFAWTYRDYVIKSLNSDRPYNLFIKDQLAADLIPSSKSQPGTLAAMGFLTGGDNFQGNKNDIINDQIDVVTKGFLGTTVTCARCHDHFFDPVPTRDYYSLYGVFNSCGEPEELPVIANSKDKKSEESYLADRSALVAKGYFMIDKEMCQMATKFNTHAATFMLGMEKMKGGKATYDAELEKDGLTPDDLQQAMRSIQIQTITKANTGMASDMMSMNQMAGTPVTTTIKPSTSKEDRKEYKKTAVKSMRSTGHPVLSLWRELARLPVSGFAQRAAESIARHTDPVNAAYVNPLVADAFRGKKITSLEAAANIYAGVFRKAEDAYVREYPSWRKSAPENAIFPGLQNPILEQVRTTVFSTKPFLAVSLGDTQKNLSKNLQNSIGSISRQLAGMDLSHPGSMARANILVDSKIKNASVFIRGEAKSPGPVVPRQFLEFIQADRKPFPPDSSGRLQLAEAIADNRNPLTPRVLVNRVWLHHFGEGFVSTPDDLGVMSEAPSHLELCNWLSAKFMEDGWSLKKLHKLIMTSSVYQQASDPNPDYAKNDPFNRLLWRANVRRLDFEALRDSFLAIGGKIDLTMFGHPMNIETEPYSPRRTIYGFVDRLNMAEFMKNFDMANAQLPTGRRHETIVPQQALFRMNSLLVIEQARNVIVRPEFQKATTDAARIKMLYEIIYQRWPKPEEIKLAQDFLLARQSVTVTKKSAFKGTVPDEDEGARKARIEEFLNRDPKSLNSKERMQQIEMKKRMAEQMMKSKQGGKLNELVSDPNAERVSREALTNWEEFAQALLMTTEAAYLN